MSKNKSKRPPPILACVIDYTTNPVLLPDGEKTILNGKSLEQHVAERVMKCENTFHVYGYTDANNNNIVPKSVDGIKYTEMEKLKLKEKLHCILDCMNHCKADVCVILSLSCPFVDYRVIDEAVNLLIWRKLDYVSNVYPRRTFQKGLDVHVVSRDAIEAAVEVLTTKKERDDFIKWLQKTDEVTKASIVQRKDMSDEDLSVVSLQDVKRINNYILMQKAKMSSVN